MSASLADQQSGSGICMRMTFKKSLFFLSTSFLPLCLQCGHLICSSGSFMGILRMVLRMVEQKHKTNTHLCQFNGTAITTLVFLFPVFLYIKMKINLFVDAVIIFLLRI